MALARGGEAIDDPIAWLDSLSDEAWQFWLGFAKVEPFGRDFERHAIQMTMLDRLYAAQFFGKYKVQMPDAFLPEEYYEPPKKQKPDKQKLLSQLDTFVKAYSR